MRFLGVLIFLFPVVVEAGLDEEKITTPDGQCALYYLTRYPRSGWTIQTDKKQCRDGVVQGYAQVKLYNAHHQLSEKLSGFFLDGYWLGSFMGQGPVLDRTTPEEGQQALTFQLGQDDQATYVAQLRAVQEEDRPYGPFTGCPDFRVMAVVKDVSLFQEDTFQDKIAHQANQYARSLCSDLETIAVFGATKLKPTASDIIFQMQIEADTQERQIIPLIKMTDTVAGVPVELRQQNSKIVFQNDIPVSRESSATFVPQKPFKRTALAHLDVLSRVLGKPVKGKIIVHVKQLNLDGSALVDLPQPLLLKNSPDLTTGWLEVSGQYHQGQMRVNEVKKCSKRWCADDV